MFKRTAIALATLLLLASAAQAQKKEPPKPSERPPLNDMAYQIGEIRRVVKGDDSPLLHLGMAPSGSTIIEFPASDHYFAAHTSDIGDWVRVEKSPSRLTDNHLVLRPGKDLQGSETSALVQVQMRSGLLVTLCVHPTKFAGAQTRRVVVSYNRDEIVAARQRAGLAVDLGPEERPITTVRDPQPAEAKPVVEENVAAPPQPTAEEVAAKLAAEKKAMVDSLLSKTLKDALRRAEVQPKQHFKKWSSATHGLSVSTRTYDLNEEIRIALVAIRNVEEETLRIMPGHPELVIETQNDKGRVVQLIAVQKRLEETSSTSQMIPGGKTVYYAIAYPPPILSTKQKLRVTVGQQAAADAPAAADITARRNEK